MSFSLSTNRIEELCDVVDQSTNLEDLSRIMQDIGMALTEVQTMVKQKILDLSHAAVRTAELNVLPIDAVLPMDIMCSILSFVHYSETKMVSKSFKSCFQRNQDIARRSRQQSVNDYAHHFAPEIIFDESVNQTILLRAKEIPWVASIQELRGEVIVHTQFEHCVTDTRLSSGDRILIHNGYYEMNSDWDIQHNIEVIGLGDDVEIKFMAPNYKNTGIDISKQAKVLFKHLRLLQTRRLAYSSKYSLISRSCTVWMDDVTFDRFGQINAPVFHTNSCHFIRQRDRGPYPAVYVRSKDTRILSNFIGCTFDEHDTYIRSKHPVRCVGNVFASNDGLLHCQTYMSQSILKGNIFEGRIVDKDCSCGFPCGAS